MFGNEQRPDHFTDYLHCLECEDHDNTFQAHDPDTIGYDELGNPAWDPVCFATPEAFRYYFPAFVRLAVEGRDETYYLDQFLFHLILDGPRNSRWNSFSTNQRAFVVKLLKYLMEIHAEEIEMNRDTDDLFKAIEIWSDEG